MLELNKLTKQVDSMAEALAGQKRSLQDRAKQAREALQQHATVSEVLKDKLRQARDTDPSWRGAYPLGDRLDVIHQVPHQTEAVTLIATDGSQIYPDPHSFALYYLTNVGSIILRQGSGVAPSTSTDPILKIATDDPDEEQDSDRIDTDEVNLRRDLREVAALAVLAHTERDALGGDMERMIVALGDGPLLPWIPERLSNVEQERRVSQFAAHLDNLRSSYVTPLGYVDRPRSANLLRLLHLAGMEIEEITKERLRKDNPYRGLTDRILFPELSPGQRTGLFATTSEINHRYEKKHHKICFCYMNVSWQDFPDEPVLVRVETPEWIARDSGRLDEALAAVWSDCRLMQYPYVLARAHELAVVSHRERENLELMILTEMIRRGLAVSESRKSTSKRHMRK